MTHAGSITIFYGHLERKNMFLKLFLAFTLIPVVELYLLIKLGATVGAFNTLLLVIFTGAAGAYLARLQGLERSPAAMY